MGSCMDMMMRGMGGMMGGNMISGMLVTWALLFGLVALGVVLLLRTFPGPMGGVAPALRILDERLARGELDREAYLEYRRLLQHQ